MPRKGKGPRRPNVPRAAVKSRRGQERPAQTEGRSESRNVEFKDQARDVTERKAEKPRTRGGVAEQFRRARDANPVGQRSEQKQSQFRENANDASRDAGRERGRSLKPRDGWKPK